MKWLPPPRLPSWRAQRPRSAERLQALAVGDDGYTVRVLPRNGDVLIPNELPLVTWEE